MLILGLWASATHCLCWEVLRGKPPDTLPLQHLTGQDLSKGAQLVGTIRDFQWNHPLCVHIQLLMTCHVAVLQTDRFLYQGFPKTN